MPLDETEFPRLIQDLYGVVSKLEEMFPGRPRMAALTGA